MIKDIFDLQNPWRTRPDYPFPYKPRRLLSVLLDNLDNDKMIGIVGSRQVGKSSLLFLLIKYLLHERLIPAANIFYFSLDDLKLHELFHHLPDLLRFMGQSNQRRYLFLDEAQRLATPGLFLKQLYDLRLNLKVFFTGSSQLELKSKTREHLVGRARMFELQRLSFSEYLQFNEPILPQEALHELLIYGTYPEVALERDPTQKKLLLKDIYQSYVEKDITDFLKLENISAFNDLVKLVAVQSGRLLNRDNLAKTLRLSRALVDKYLQVLESTFIIKRIYPFHKNYKKEITRMPKVYFMDLGLRNFVLNNFNPVGLRTDTGVLFENFYLMELLAEDPYQLKKINFWRTTNQTEIDFIVQGENEFSAIEVKWKATGRPRSFQTIRKYYPDIQTRLVTPEDFLR
ncbi:MAG: ATP-binding protein [Calditrichaeota bacterium]|nr:MAG: ATP-binding protein [Calditrichota bacterium]